ncbi:hypothetical protein CBS101457_000102 [Exobasidium rhododendri]|nr:hypothetical protein CBS101457_000102 [Exobasidium rhododendri]
MSQQVLHKTASETDDKMDLYGSHDATEVKTNSSSLDEAVFIDPKAEAKLRRKIDMHVIPSVAIIYLFCFLDRANVGNARLAGLEKDLGMKGYDYNILLSAFYAAYILFELPSNLMCKAVGPGKWLPFLTFSFGILSLCTAFVHSFGSAIAVRFLLGVAEAGHLPGIAYYLSRWYTRGELAFRLSMYIVCAPLAGAFGGLLASGILKLDSIGGLRTWRMIFLLEGIITCVLGIISYFTITDRIETAPWLTESEKIMATSRMQADNPGSSGLLTPMKKKHVLAGIFNVTSLSLSVCFLLDNISVQGVAFFLPTIVQTLFPGKTVIHQQLLTVPPYIVGACFVLLLPYLSMKFAQRGIFVVISGFLMVIGYAMYVGSNVSNSGVRYAASFIVASGAFPLGALLPGWASANQNNDSSRAGAIGIVVMFGNAGGLVACWSYVKKDAPNYLPGNALNVGAGSGIVIIATLLTLYLRKENKKRDAQQSVQTGHEELDGHHHRDFRYLY